MSNYFRITAYHPGINESAIFDSNGYFEKIWQFSSYLMKKGFEILEVNKEDTFEDINIEKEKEDKKHIYLRACKYGKPNYIEDNIKDKKIKIIEIDGKKYNIKK